MLEAVSRVFLQPPADAAPAPLLAPPQPTPARLAVVCAAQDGPVAAGAAGLAAATAGRSGFALLAEWGSAGETPPRDRLPARVARRAAEALRMQGHAAQANGRLVHVALPPDGAEAAVRLSGLVSTPAPIVLVAAGPRDGVLDGLLAQHDRLLLVVRAGLDADLLALVQAELAALGPVVETLELPRSPAAAALARSGTALVAPLRAPFLAAVGSAQPHPAPLAHRQPRMQ